MAGSGRVKKESGWTKACGVGHLVSFVFVFWPTTNTNTTQHHKLIHPLFVLWNVEQCDRIATAFCSSREHAADFDILCRATQTKQNKTKSEGRTTDRTKQTHRKTTTSTQHKQHTQTKWHKWLQQQQRQQQRRRCGCWKEGMGWQGMRMVRWWCCSNKWMSTTMHKPCGCLDCAVNTAWGHSKTHNEQSSFSNKPHNKVMKQQNCLLTNSRAGRVVDVLTWIWNVSNHTTPLLLNNQHTTDVPCVCHNNHRQMDWTEWCGCVGIDAADASAADNVEPVG